MLLLRTVMTPVLDCTPGVPDNYYTYYYTVYHESFAVAQSESLDSCFTADCSMGRDEAAMMCGKQSLQVSSVVAPAGKTASSLHSATSNERPALKCQPHAVHQCSRGMSEPRTVTACQQPE